MQNIEIFSSVKIENFTRQKSNLQYFCSKHRLWVHEAVLTSTHNLCFGAKFRKKGIPLHITPVLLLYIKVGFKGVYITWTCFPDGNNITLIFRLFLKK